LLQNDYLDNAAFQATFVEALNNPDCIIKFKIVKQVPEYINLEVLQKEETKRILLYKEIGHLPMRRNKLNLVNISKNSKFHEGLSPISEYAPSFEPYFLKFVKRQYEIKRPKTSRLLPQVRILTGCRTIQELDQKIGLYKSGMRGQLSAQTKTTVPRYQPGPEAVEDPTLRRTVSESMVDSMKCTVRQFWNAVGRRYTD
jgi:hypothetical protein